MAEILGPSKPRSLRGQLIGLVAALVVPLIAVQIWWGYRESQRAMEDAAAQALAVADETASSVGRFLTQSDEIMTAAAAKLGRLFAAGEPCDDYISTLADIFTFLSRITTVDRDGNLMCSSTSPIPLGTSAGGGVWFPRMKEDPRFYIGNPVLSDISGRWVLPLVAPVLDTEGRFAGALAGALPLLEFDRMLGGDRRDEEILVTITTPGRVVVARSSDAELWVGRQLPPWERPDGAVGSGRITVRGLDYDGIERAWGLVELENGWWVNAGLHAQDVYGPARALAAREISITLLILIVGMLIASRAYRRIGSALRELATGIPREGDAVPLPQGTPTEVRAVVEQFNETLRSRNRAEAAERGARERYESIFQNAVFGLLVSTVDGGFLEVNAALVSMLGYESASALIEAGPEALYPEPSIRSELVEMGLGAQIVEQFEVDWVRADGQPITVRLNGKVIQTPAGEPAFEVIVQDITDEKRRDTELRHTQKMEAIGKLAGGIAHDFNNLLTVIGGNAKLIDDGVPPDHSLRAEVEQIMKATERATSLTTQLLAFSRKEPLGVCLVDLNEVLTNMEKMLVRLIGEDVTLETRVAADLPQILIDRGELEQIIMNLVLNARDAMPRGGRVIIETRSAPIDVRGECSVTEDSMLLSLRDDGLGMDSET
ncbi:MAG: PAS domain S-box protein, partial [Actinobacteria bacterium]|nr:PAS domain S-box protein [Actinomycetota bacterium]